MAQPWHGVCKHGHRAARAPGDECPGHRPEARWSWALERRQQELGFEGRSRAGPSGPHVAVRERELQGPHVAVRERKLQGPHVVVRERMPGSHQLPWGPHMDVREGSRWYLQAEDAETVQWEPAQH